jgi:phosphoglycolate phosphatase-like HAD superfamily hydrolase
MTLIFPDLLALDFDGVVCDGLIEYFVSTRKAYQQLWQSEPMSGSMSDRLASSFYQLRPVIETGWEMPILLRALVLGIPEAEILLDWQRTASKIVEAEGLDKSKIVQKLDGVRDEQIKDDLDGWLGLHRFYPGIIEYLRHIIDSNVNLYIVTTKEGRFVKRLLQQQGINLSEAQIIGKESKRPKYETLRILHAQHQIGEKNISISFVEDRLEALQQVAQQPDLNFVSLFLADWGYNLESDRTTAQANNRIQLLSIEQFQQQFVE